MQKGWQIFVHAVQLVLQNIETAIRITLIPYVIYSGCQIWFSAKYGHVFTAMESAENALPQIPSGFVGGALLTVVLAVLMSIWIVVAWHRFVLLNERGNGWIPAFDFGRFLGYLGRSILVGLIAVLAAVVVSIPVGLVSVIIPPIAVLLPAAAVAVIAIVLYRLGVILPAGAVDEKLTLSEAWDATRGTSGVMVILVIIMIVFSILMQLPNLVGGDPYSIISTIYGAVIGWFMMLIGAGILTTIYGHYVEKRPIGQE